MFSLGQLFAQNERKYDKFGGYYGLMGGEMAHAEKNGKMSYIDREENMIIPLQYQRAKDFKNNLAPVLKNNKWSYIDKTGKQIIQFLYDDAEAYISEDEIMPVKLDGIWFYINRKGVETERKVYDSEEDNDTF